MLLYCVQASDISPEIARRRQKALEYQRTLELTAAEAEEKRVAESRERAGKVVRQWEATREQVL